MEAGIRVFEVAGRSLVITLSGAVDASWTGQLAGQVESRGDRDVVVDLRDATYVDADVQSFLISAARRAPVTIVAEQWLLHVFELTRHTRSLRLATSLAAAL
jgi:anti-anti-sigma regulatory factor